MHITWSKAHSSSPGWSVRAGSGSSLDGGRRPTKLRTAGGLPDALESMPMASDIPDVGPCLEVRGLHGIDALRVEHVSEEVGE